MKISMRSLKLILLAGVLAPIFLISSSSLADDTTKWTQLVAKVVQTGKDSQAPSGEYRTVTRSVPANLHQSHQVDYFSAVGGVDSKGVFGVDHVEVVSEDWQLEANGDWNIDQWLFVVSAQAQMTWAEHRHLVESNQGTVLSQDTISADDPTKASAWSQELGTWEN